MCQNEKIISVLFKVESEGYQAMTELRNAPEAEDYIVSQAALIKKENGVIHVLDSFDTGIETENDTLIGGIVGGLIGILAGPLGMLLGSSLGMMTVRGKMMLPPHGKEIFTRHGKQFFTSRGKDFFT